MHNPSPFELIRKAAGRGNNADRWAALINNSQTRMPVTKETPIAQQAEKPASAGAPEEAAYSQLMQPPFPPPQPRHPFLDEIAQRHTQAIKSAKKPQEWVMHKAMERPQVDPNADAKPADHA